MYEPFSGEKCGRFSIVCLSASKLIELTDGECCVIPELVDWNDPYGRILKINVKQNGEYAITIASVE